MKGGSGESKCHGGEARQRPLHVIGSSAPCMYSYLQGCRRLCRSRLSSVLGRSTVEAQVLQ